MDFYSLKLHSNMGGVNYEDQADYKWGQQLQTADDSLAQHGGETGYLRNTSTVKKNNPKDIEYTEQCL